MNYDEMQQLSLLIKDSATFKNHTAYLWRLQPPGCSERMLEPSTYF